MLNRNKTNETRNTVMYDGRNTAYTLTLSRIREIFKDLDVFDLIRVYAVLSKAKMSGTTEHGDFGQDVVWFDDATGMCTKGDFEYYIGRRDTINGIKVLIAVRYRGQSAEKHTIYGRLEVAQLTRMVYEELSHR